MKICYPQCSKCSETVTALLGSTVVCPMCGEHVSTAGFSGEFFSPELPATTAQSSVDSQGTGAVLARFFIPMLIFSVICGLTTGLLLMVMSRELATWVGVISMFILLPIYSLADCAFNRDLVWCPLRASCLQVVEGIAIWCIDGFSLGTLEVTCLATMIAWIASGVICLIARVVTET